MFPELLLGMRRDAPLAGMAGIGRDADAGPGTVVSEAGEE
jgi:hypothetical protein